MIPYFVLLGLPIWVHIFGRRYRITAGRKLLFESDMDSMNIFMVIFFLLLALRGLDCGVDTTQYYRAYEIYSGSSIDHLIKGYDRELGYRLVNKLVGITVDDFQFFLMLTSGICVFPLWKLYKKKSEDYLLTIVLFLSVSPFAMYFSGIRQAIAMSLGIFAWEASKDRRIVLFILIVLLAMQFHTSAFILFVMYPLYYAKITTRWLWLVVPSMFMVYIYKDNVFRFLLTFLWEEYETTPETGATTVFILLILFAIFSYVIPDSKLLDSDTIALRNMLLLSVFIQVFATLHPLSMRMNYYFLIFVPVLIPKIIDISQVRYKQISGFSRIIMTIYFAYYFVNKVVNDIDALNIFPYIPFWKN